jgi:hypothetical protein
MEDRDKCWIFRHSESDITQTTRVREPWVDDQHEI